MLGFPIGDEYNVVTMSTTQWKKFVKEKVNIAAFKYFKSIQQTHSKTKHIKYKSLELQSYLRSPMFSDIECEILFKLRSKTHMYKCNMKASIMVTCHVLCSALT